MKKCCGHQEAVNSALHVKSNLLDASINITGKHSAQTVI
jgi:hypothetical protein